MPISQLAPQPHPYSALLSRLATDPAAPLITDVDLTAQTRVELSVATACNGVAKAAHLFGALAQDLGRPPRLGLALPPHWQSWTVVMGAWAIGAELVIDPGLDQLSVAALDGLVLGPAELTDPPSELPDNVWISRLHPFGLPFDPAPPFPLEDLTAALRPQSDEPPPLAMGATADLGPDADADTHALFATLDPAARILTVLPWAAPGGLRCAFSLPLEHRRSVILVRGVGGPDDQQLERTAASEGAAVTAGVDVRGHPRIA